MSSNLKHRFTVEQFELIRRLRNSGVTCQQIIESFQAFDRIDAELGALFASPVSGVSQPHHPSNNASMTSQMTQQLMRRPPGPGNPFNNTGSNPFTPTNFKTSTPLTSVANSNNKSATASHTDPKTACDSNDSTDNTGNNNNTVNANMTDNNVSSSSRSTPNLNIKNEPQFYQDIDTDKTMELLLSQSPENVMEMIRRCVVSLPDFNPTEVSSIPGMTETSLTQLLSGDLNALELSIKYKVLEWFIYHLRRTDWFSTELNVMLRMTEPEGLGVHFTPRRERFMFRDKHLEVLETFFKKVQYPTLEEKEHIANECNVAMAASRDRELEVKEKMTPFNVGNWFSNRRKEIKRLAKMGGIETEKVILPSRLKAKPVSNLPTYGDLMTADNRMNPLLGVNSHYDNYSMSMMQRSTGPGASGDTSGIGITSVHSEKMDSDSSDDEDMERKSALTGNKTMSSAIKLEPCI